MVSIVIPVWNQLEFTEDCIGSIKAFTTVPYKVIIVNNGSTDGTQEYLKYLVKSDPKFVVIENKENRGFPAAVNQGVQYALALTKCEHVIILNNDVIVTPGWVEGMLDCMMERPDIGIVGAMTNSISGVQQVNEGKYETSFELLEFSKNFRTAFRGRYFALWRIVFFCTLIKREVFERIGMLDEAFSPGNFEDDDFCLRSLNAGFVNFVAGDTFVHHYGSASHKGIDHAALLEKNKKIFLDKWLKKEISCCMIVKNEEKNINKCLDSVLPLVDEVILVDTGSTDKTLDIIRQRREASEKIKLFHHVWTDDFSEARNFSLKMATKDWILIMDADEVIRKLDKDALYPMCAYQFETRNYTNNPLVSANRQNNGEYGDDEAGLFWFPSVKARLFPNDERVHFQFPVHEVVEESIHQLGLWLLPNTTPIHHYGRLNDKAEVEKGQAYNKLLQEIIKSNPTDIRNLRSHATQLQSLAEWDRAIETWDKILAIDPEYYDAWHNKGHCFAQRDNDWQKVIECENEALKIKPKDKDALYNKAYSYFRLKNYPKAIALAEEILKEDSKFVLAVALRNAARKKHNADVAPTVEQLPCKQTCEGSSPSIGSK